MPLAISTSFNSCEPQARAKRMNCERCGITATCDGFDSYIGTVCSECVFELRDDLRDAILHEHDETEEES
jgi:hypothetical protein